MKTTCPNCQLQGLVETAQLSMRPSVVCPRCAQSFEVLLFDDVLDIPLASHAGHTGDLAPVLTELSIKPAPAFISSSSAQAAAGVTTLSNVDVLDEKIAIAEEEPSGSSISRLYSENELIELEELPGFESETVSHEDKYSLGVRLMRISPIWIFIGGIVLISLLLLLGSLRPAEKTEETASVNPAASEESNSPIVRATAEGVKVEPAKVEPPKPEPAKVETQASQPVESVDTTATASVKATPMQPAESLNTVSQSSAAPVQQNHVEQSGNGYVLQFGSHPQSQAAEDQAAHLRAAGVEARVLEALIPKRGTWYRVQAGNFGTAEEAMRYANDLRSRGLIGEFIVVAPSGR